MKLDREISSHTLFGQCSQGVATDLTKVAVTLSKAEMIGHLPLPPIFQSFFTQVLSFSAQPGNVAYRTCSLKFVSTGRVAAGPLTS